MFFFFKQKTAYEMRISDWSSDVCSSDLTDPDLAFPYLLLLVSGGHCQLLLVSGVGVYRRLATTIDDAAGEAFAKTAKLPGLGYPGGPAVERAARDGDQIGRASCRGRVCQDV